MCLELSHTLYVHLRRWVADRTATASSATGEVGWDRGRVDGAACTCVRLESVGKRIVAWRTHRDRSRTMDPFNYPRDSTRRRKQAPSRTGRCAASRPPRLVASRGPSDNKFRKYKQPNELPRCGYPSEIRLSPRKERERERENTGAPETESDAEGRD